MSPVNISTSKNRSIITAALFALALSLLPQTAFSAQKVAAGAPCKSLNAKSTVKNKTYTCIKKGSKLVWNKGVTTKTAAPTPSSTQSAPEKPADPFAIYGPEGSRFKAVEEYGIKLVATRKKEVSNIESILETPDDPLVIRMTQNAQYAYSLFEQFMPLGFTPKWIVGQRESWLQSQLKDTCPNLASNIRPNSGAATCRMTVVWRDLNARDDENNRNLMLVQGGHEIFHLYQQELWKNYWSATPDWLREGSASVAMGIVLTHFEDRKSFPEYGAAQRVARSPKDKNTCEEALTKWEKNATADGFGFNNGCEYGLGLLMNEFLIMKGFTLKDTLDVVKAIGTGVDFPTAFQQVYKISTTEYFQQLRAYLKTLNYGW